MSTTNAFVLNAAGNDENGPSSFRSQDVLTSVALLMAISTALAPTARAQDQAGEGAEEIVVTGTRVARDGYEAPTPLTAINIDEMKDSAPANIADLVNELPQLAGSASPQSSITSVSAGGTGINSLNLRNLGTTRTLVLLDGRRSVGSQPTGQVDVNTFPQQLVRRVDVVTGGASAAYGSDAVSGVVNFVLDRQYTGTTADVQAGGTTHGDDNQWKVAVATGSSFADGRGHVLFSGEISRVDGVWGCPRDWCEQGWNLINNPDYAPGSGLPERLILPQTAPSNQAPGGIITSGPLAGTAFGPGGTPYQFHYGNLHQDPWMQGGQWRANDVHDTVTLNPSADRQNLFGRVSYELTSDVEVFAQWSYGKNESLTATATHFNPGNITIAADNAFIPADIRARMEDLALTSLQMGTYSSDLDIIQARNVRVLRSYVIGANGNLDVFNRDWSWDVYYQYGESEVTKTFYDRLRTPFSNAIDAVRDPDTGAIVCRSTLSNPNDGCIPWNVFGEGVNSEAAIDYITDWSWALETNEQQVAAVSFSGAPFSTWAGDASLAAGVEHRRESGGGQESALNAANEFWVGTQAPTIGSYDVTEGFLETVIPLADGESWADAMDVNAAIRVTDYSTSGVVNTWKIGASFSPTPDIRFRATRSRDIRAPHRQELFAAGIYTGNVIVDPFRGGQLTDVQSLLTGNIDLVPEEAETTGLGVVYRPSWASGLSASVDYYNIKINNAIGTVARQETVDRCFRGEDIFCGNLERNADGVITVVRIQPTNFVSQLARGVDIESSYQLPLENLRPNLHGDLTLRALATRYLKNVEDTGSGPITDTVGENGGNGPPKWRYRVSLIYSNDSARLSLTGRGVSSGVYDNTNIECTVGCPDSSGFNRTINTNHIPGTFLLDAAFTYKVYERDGREIETFLSVQNVTDKEPALVAQGPGGVAFSTPPVNPRYYDVLGRSIRVGFRLDF